MHTHTRTSSAGHTQTWSMLGPAEGRPVLFFHGGNDCRLEAYWIEDAAHDAGVRLITPDRPGFGGSTHVAGRSFTDGARAALELLDHLGLERVSVLGLSGGGPHALAFAALAPERVWAVDIVASPCPWEQRGFLRGTWLPIRLAYLLARYAPRSVLTAVQRAMNDAERNLAYADRMPAPDAALLRTRPAVGRAMVRSVTEAHRLGFAGAVHEWRLYTRPWGFSLSAVRTPVRLWYGTEDGMAPPQMGERLQALLPDASLTVIPARAHLSIFVEEAHRFLRPLEQAHGLTVSG